MSLTFIWATSWKNLFMPYTTKAQISLRIQTVCSAPLLFTAYKVNDLYLVNILSVNEKLLLLKFRYFGNYKRNHRSFFALCVSGLLQTYLEQYSASAGTMEQLLYVHFVLFAVFQNFENIIFKNKHASVYLNHIPWKRHQTGFDYSIK